VEGVGQRAGQSGVGLVLHLLGVTELLVNATYPLWTDDGSTFTPGPMVEVTAMRFT